jgi:dihydrofolate reductase
MTSHRRDAETRRRAEIMRKLKLQMQITVDGFVAGPNGELDWMNPDMEIEDDKIFQYINFLIDSSDTILMGRKMTDEFVNYWTNVVKNPKSPWHEFANKMVDTPKVVFTRTFDESPWLNTVLAKGDIVEEVNQLKNRPGKDLLAYGGAGFVSSLIKHDLIDEYQLFVNPVAISKGMTIFGELGDYFKLKQTDATPYECGVTVHTYLPDVATKPLSRKAGSAA